MKNIGIFSGSFNPIHVGHLILGNYITEFTDIDEVWFMVSPQNPLKNSNQLNELCRLDMVKLALEGYSSMKACNYEFSLSRPSYTANTFTGLKKDFPDCNFSLIIGADNWKLFNQWKNSDQILDNHSIYIYPRLHFDIAVDKNPSHRIIELDAPVIEISSTFIREGIMANKDMKAFLPEKVYSYIRSQNLYFLE